MRLPALALSLASLALCAQGPNGYYRFPAPCGQTLVFGAEGDLWTAPLAGGAARRLTSHPGAETFPSVSPDGKTLAFVGTYEGVPEVYTMPLEGGLPTRQTWDGENKEVAGWTPEGRILVATRSRSTLPEMQLMAVDPATHVASMLPLAQAAEGCYGSDGKTLFFTRLPMQGSHTARYKGGTAQSLWRWDGQNEAQPLTADFAGTSKNPMAWKGRIVFISDRDGTMNLWSMDEQGHDLKQLTRHKGWDIQRAALSGDAVVYQLGADLRRCDLATGQDTAIPLSLATDLDQEREQWVKAPMDYLTSAHLSPDGDRVVLTARGQVFVAPAGPGRLVEASRAPGVRYRDARFMPDGKTLETLSDESGETEFWALPANGVGAKRQMSKDGRVLRWEGIPSPDGRWIAYADKDQKLWILEAATGKDREVDSSQTDGITGLRWSPDSKWLAYARRADDNFSQVMVAPAEGGKPTALTSDRYDAYDPAWSPDGRWLYLLSDRTFQSVVGAPWGVRNPEPFFDKSTRIFQIALQKGLRSPFQPKDELAPAKEDKKDPKAPLPAIDFDGIQGRLSEVPVPPGNYASLSANGDRLFWLSNEAAAQPKLSLQSLPISNDGPQPSTVLEDLKSYELSADGKKLLAAKGNDLLVFEAGAKGPDLAKAAVPLRGWTFALDPKEEWRQMYTEAWRLERDYFYDRGMHHLDWKAVHAKYLPLVDRVTNRAELSDILGQMIGELSALHMFVYGGDQRKGNDAVQPASLGAVLAPEKGGLRVAHLYQGDPDLPETLSPLARPGVEVKEGDLIEAINGVPTAGLSDAGALLRQQAGKQVLIHVKGKDGAGRDAIVTPNNAMQASNLRYDEWENGRRAAVEKLGGGKLGYVHLRSMGPEDIAQWYRDFYPVAGREGLVIDARHNRGGNIDSWILEKLLRKAWFWWQPRVGAPNPNMQDAFRGKLVVLCDAFTASDGEAFTEGIRRLGLGKVVGSRTWGGEIWLSSSNFLVDKGIATAAETGVYGPEGSWLIEGHGVEPDLVVDNLPHATYEGGDAQLEAAVRLLQQEIAADPKPVPAHPAYPDKRAD